ncbi:PQQ-dependent sugar dehydrogenase [Phenylobacterium kunshanense]|nr:PQQ-dependent sugar dehydrogenase [Phenylobacterium kunshanense]
MKKFLGPFCGSLVLAFSPAAHSADNTAAAPASVALEREVVASGLRHPWGMAFLPDGRALVTEKEGGLWLIDLSRGTRIEVQGLPDDVASRRLEPRDNSGLFDVAVDPRFAKNGRIFLSYASRGGAAADAPTTTKLISARVELGPAPRLLDVATWFEALPRSTDRFHYGGGLLLDGGHLYLTVGERHFFERDNPPVPVAQDPADRRGKIYRFSLGSAPTQPEVIATGIRATQGLARQPETGLIWFTEHGSLGGDELNILRSGANYGWPFISHGAYRDGWVPPGRSVENHAPPVFYWADRTVAPTGLTFVNDQDPEFAAWRGDLMVAGLRRGYLMRIDVEGDRVVAVDYLLEDAPVRLRNVKQAPDGRMYVLTDEADGKVIRLRRRLR